MKHSFSRGARRTFAVLMMLVMIFAVALPCSATDDFPFDYPEDTQNGILIAPAPDAVISDADVSDADVSETDVSPADVSASDGTSQLRQTFKLMGQGMLGIFVVMFLLYLVVIILNKTTQPKAEEE